MSCSQDRALRPHLQYTLVLLNTTSQGQGLPCLARSASGWCVNTLVTFMPLLCFVRSAPRLPTGLLPVLSLGICTRVNTSPTPSPVTLLGQSCQCPSPLSTAQWRPGPEALCVTETLQRLEQEPYGEDLAQNFLNVTVDRVALSEQTCLQVFAPDSSIPPECPPACPERLLFPGHCGSTSNGGLGFLNHPMELSEP